MRTDIIVDAFDGEPTEYLLLLSMSTQAVSNWVAQQEKAPDKLEILICDDYNRVLVEETRRGREKQQHKISVAIFFWKQLSGHEGQQVPAADFSNISTVIHKTLTKHTES
jgi:hypothetical protein